MEIAFRNDDISVLLSLFQCIDCGSCYLHAGRDWIGKGGALLWAERTAPLCELFGENPSLLVVPRLHAHLMGLLHHRAFQRGSLSHQWHI